MTGVFFLRGINLGKRRLTNDELVAAATDAGLPGTTAYQASGNLLFAHENPPMSGAFSAGLERALGYEVACFRRSASELSDLLANQPFSADQLAKSKGKPQVTFLAAAPDAATAAQVEAVGTEDDRVAVVGAHWFWLPENGVGRSALDVRAIEALVGRGTTRTVGTVERILKKL